MKRKNPISATAAAKTLVLQQDQRDCGVACLLSLIRYYKGNGTMDQLRRLSGTSIDGTTLLGLYEAASRSGFTAEGCEGDMEALINHDAPLILHFIHNEQDHFVICYGMVLHKGESCFLIGDPAQGIVYLTAAEVDQLWATKTCLTLLPNEHFVQEKEINEKKREWMAQLIREDYPLLLIAAAIGVIVAILNMVMAIFSQRLIDDILPAHDIMKFNLGIVLVLILLSVKEAMNTLRQYFLLRQSKDFNNRIIGRFFNNLLSLPKAFFDTRKIGELTARLNDTARIQKLISQLAGNVIIDILVVLVSLIFLAVYSWPVAVILVVLAPIYFLLVYKHNKMIIAAQQQVMMSYAASESNYIATLQGIETVKNCNQEEAFQDSNQLIYAQYQDKIFSLGKIQMRLGFLANIAGVGILTGILTVATYMVFHHHIKVGELIAILGVCTMVLPAIGNLALVAIPVNEAKVAFNRMFEFIHIEQEENRGETKIDKMPLSLQKLDIQHLSFRFPGQLPLLENVQLTVQKGQMVALMGENGSGKSTLAQIIQGFYSWNEGEIWMNDELPLKAINLYRWRETIGVVSQQIQLFNGTVLQNIAFDDAIKKPEAVMDFLYQYGFVDFLHKLPRGLLTLIGEEGVNLSGGQKQMVALARALYRRPQLLILDEATSAMDRISQQFVLQLLQRLKKEMAILFITHRLHILKEYSDHIYILEQGRIQSVGTHDSLLDTDNLYSAYWNDLHS